ncbi:MAG: hypothetical protein AAGF23_15155, partial [Acidobacteriota bacterium]
VWLSRPDGAPPESATAQTAASTAPSGFGKPASAGASPGLLPADRDATIRRVRAALGAGDTVAARAAAEPFEGTRGDPEVAALLAEVEALEMEREALGILDEARANAAPSSDAGAAATSGPAPGDTVADRPPSNGIAITGPAVAPPPPPPTPPPPPRRTAADFQRQAERQKDAKQYHSLKRTLDDWIRTGRATAEAHTWRGKVDRWIRSREDDLRDELEDHLDDLVDAIEDRDLEDLGELWAKRPDAPTRERFRRLFESYRELEAEASILESRPVDDRIDFVVEVRIRGQEDRHSPEKAIRTDRWRGRLVDDDDEVRFVSPFPN